MLLQLNTNLFSFFKKYGYFTTTSGKTFELKDFKTRKIDREYQEILSEGMMVTAGGEISNINPQNVQKANDYLIAQMAGLADEEIDNMNVDDYNEILATINKNDAKKV